MTDIQQAIQTRRSNYSINNKTQMSDEEIIKRIRTAVKNCPSAFNSQSSRVVILLNEEHKKFWQLTFAELQKHVSKDKISATENKINSFAAGKGTLLFFEEEETIERLEKQFPLYSANFKSWSEQGNAMLQYAIWCLLSDEGMGASLQHYSPLIDDFVHKTWHLPSHWKMIAQMPFGNITQAAGIKEFMPLEERIKIFA